VDDYVRLRPGGDDAVLGLLAQRHPLRGKQVLELGCGPGRAAGALAARHGAHVTATDASADMLAAARSIVPRDVRLVEARAEALPFADASFDLAFANFVIHLLDRRRAFAEVRRVLRPGGVLWLKTADPDRVGDFWAAPLLPSWESIEAVCFPGETALRAELVEAGFVSIELDRVRTPHVLSRAEAIERLESRAFSTMSLVPPAELTAAIAAAAELPETVRHTSTMLVVSAS